ncbi:MAG TPA: hypothetical protein VFI73_05905 [Candidatus Nitrosopolaris sp.]|nr:hypothetical protein [Candidatus Nitrosopolaris sp.]
MAVAFRVSSIVLDSCGFRKVINLSAKLAAALADCEPVTAIAVVPYSLD